jgi:multidrug efflux system outer membrane protein
MIAKKSMRSVRLAVASLGAFVLLAGCNLAPTYQAPESPVGGAYPDQPQTSYDATTGQFRQTTVSASSLSEQPSDAAELAWQTFFQDPQLKALIGLSLDNNRDLEIAIARMQEAEAIWGRQRGEMLPQLGAALSGARQRSPSPFSSSNVVTSQYSAGIAVTAFELDLFGRLRNLSEAAFQRYLASAEGARGVQITLVADTAIQFFRFRMAQVMRDVTEQTLASRKRSFDLVDARFRRGIASEMDAVQAKALVDAAAADLAQFIREQAQAKNALAVLIGQPLPQNLPDALPFDDLGQLATVPAGLPADLITRRPDIRAAENQLLAANANIGAARAAFLPNVSLTGSLGTVSTSFGDLFGSGSGVWAFTPSISLPLFRGGTLQAGLAQVSAVQRAAIARYEQNIEQAFREVADALAGEGTLQSQFDARSAQRQASERFLTLSNARFFNGIDSFLDVQIAETQVYQAQILQVQTGFETLSNRVNLYKALGGGWDESVPGAVKRASVATGTVVPEALDQIRTTSETTATAVTPGTSETR